MSGTPCITDVIRRALAALHEGVTLAVTALDRLGRSTMDTRGFPAQLRAAAPASAYRTPAAAAHPPPTGSRVHPQPDPIGDQVFGTLASHQGRLRAISVCPTQRPLDASPHWSHQRTSPEHAKK
ncbi:hypothetical protein [Clavibacter michiganensis]|uniref:hypothetical protein n=1 Tax=Clavibacter michiganensis TaxID=28447 RepID=UPI002E806251|nr:hypothetical protein [Clavibacter michiganensis]